MKKIIILFLVLFCLACLKSINKVSSPRDLSKSRPVDTLYEKDKIDIAKTFTKNVEAIRLSMDNDNHKIHSSFDGDPDPENIYTPYAIRYNYKTEKFVASPLPTSEQISTYTTSIVYSSDSLLCVAFIVIDNHFTDLYPYEKDRIDNGPYDGRALIGYRQNLNERFKIYPFDIYTILGMDEIGFVTYLLRSYYFHDIIGQRGPAGTNIEGIEYKYGIGDPKFFYKAPNFIKNKQGKYKFEYYREGDKFFPYILY